MKKCLAVALVLMTLALSGCETAGGFGRDVQHAGRWIQNLAN